jgi:hypothetical protein
MEQAEGWKGAYFAWIRGRCCVCGQVLDPGWDEWQLPAYAAAGARDIDARAPGRRRVVMGRLFRLRLFCSGGSVGGDAWDSSA